jgi:hypothetical protein
MTTVTKKDEWNKQSNRWFLSSKNLASISNEILNTEQKQGPKRVLSTKFHTLQWKGHGDDEAGYEVGMRAFVKKRKKG